MWHSGKWNNMPGFWSFYCHKTIVQTSKWGKEKEKNIENNIFELWILLISMELTMNNKKKQNATDLHIPLSF